MIPGCIQRHLSTPSSIQAVLYSRYHSILSPLPLCTPSCQPQPAGPGGLLPPPLRAAGIWEGRTRSPDAGRRRVPRYFISTDRTVPLQAVTVLHLLPVLSKTLKLTLRFISRSDRCQRRGKERALNSPGRHRPGSQRHLCTASKAAPWLQHPPKHRECKGKRMHEDRTRVRNAATGTRPPQRSPRGLRIRLPGLGKGTRAEVRRRAFTYSHRQRRAGARRRGRDVFRWERRRSCKTAERRKNSVAMPSGTCTSPGGIAG